MNPRRSGRAFSLAEALVVVALSSLLSLMVLAALHQALSVHNRNSGRDLALRELQRARQALERDLTQAASNFRIEAGPGSLGPGSDGDALVTPWALQPTGSMALLSDGSGNPYNFCNLYYYLTIPSNHDSLFSGSCSGNSEPGYLGGGGYDYCCPHKILVRALADTNPSYNPSDPSSSEDPIAPLSPYLIRPLGFPKTSNRQTMAINLLTLQMQKQGGQILVELRAVALAEARRQVAIGQTSLKWSPHTLETRFSLFPLNP